MNATRLVVALVSSVAVAAGNWAVAHALGAPSPAALAWLVGACLGRFDRFGRFACFRFFVFNGFFRLAYFGRCIGPERSALPITFFANSQQRALRIGDNHADDFVAFHQ